MAALYQWLGQLAMKDRNDNEELAIWQRAREAFRAHRTARGWSRREMAQFLGVTEDNYESYEGRDDRGIPSFVIARFCNYTDVDLAWIMLGRSQATSKTA